MKKIVVKKYSYEFFEVFLRFRNNRHHAFDIVVCEAETEADEIVEEIGVDGVVETCREIERFSPFPWQEEGEVEQHGAAQTGIFVVVEGEHIEFDLKVVVEEHEIAAESASAVDDAETSGEPAPSDAVLEIEFDGIFVCGDGFVDGAGDGGVGHNGFCGGISVWIEDDA